MQHSLLKRTIWPLLLVALFNVEVRGQTVGPSNDTVDGTGYDVGAEIALFPSYSNQGTALDVFPLLGLTSAANFDTPNYQLEGTVLLANASSELMITDSDIAFISCDPGDYQGDINANDVVLTAQQQKAIAIILYSSRTPACAYGAESSSYSWIYTMTSEDDTKLLLSTIASNGGPPFGTVVPNGTYAVTSTNGTPTTNPQQNPLGPSPSTAVAMIILYSITGVITVLFLMVIISGAIRAHRHPERYGPRAGIGRPRQSRARGLARAMLETIPIVKFGDRETETNSKSADVELTAAGHSSAEALPETADRPKQPSQTEKSNDDLPAKEAAQGSSGGSDNQESGIAPALAEDASSTPLETQGCSICTEDFEIGQDQRVLPCDHRFHPACIDPWLLNVSGTCPLCRIDLRPNADEPSGADVDSALAPPLENDPVPRLGVRQSIVAGFLSLRPERMSREERLQALRRFREHQSMMERERPAEEQNRTGRRLRSAFRVRTRRTVADGQTQDVAEQ